MRRLLPALGFGLMGLVLPRSASAAELVVEWDLSVNDGGFRPDGNKLQWEWGPVKSGPGSGLYGSAGWATILDGPHLQSADDTLQLALVQLSGTSAPVLQLDHWYLLEEDTDMGTVEIFGSGGWTTVEPIYGYPRPDGFSGESGGWVTHWFDLSGVAATSLLRLRFQSNETVPLAGWYLGAITVWDGDPVPPDLSEATELPDSTSLGHPFPVAVTAVDDQALANVNLAWWSEAEGLQAVEMTSVGGGRFEAELAAQDTPDTLISWWITATDTSGNSATLGPESFRVYLPAPSDLSVPEGRLIGTETTLSWTAPDADDPVISYEIYRDGSELVAQSQAPSVEVPLDSSVHTFEVAARFDTDAGELLGDRSEILGVVVTLPEVRPLEPAEGWQGTRVRVAITGSNLLLTEDDVALSLGEDVTVDEISVENADHLEAMLIIAADASTGLRDLRLWSGGVETLREDAFQVFDGTWAPRITAVTPEAVEQGDHLILELELNDALEVSPEVDLGDGIIVEEVVLDEDGTRLLVTIAVANDAPLGMHAISVDDGVRVLGGMQLRVRDRSVTVDSTCGCAQTGSAPHLPLLLGLLALLGLRRRR